MVSEHRIKQRGNTGSTQVTVAIVLATIAVILAIVWTRRPGPEVEANRQLQGELMLQATGLGRPVQNKLAGAFVDADGDLVADVPADASKQIDPSTIYVSYVAGPEADRLAQVFAPMIAQLSSKLGRPVEYVTITDPEDQLRALADGTLHISAFNTGAVPVAVNAAGFVPVASLGNDAGTSTTGMRLIASATTAIQSPADIRGKELVLTDPTSNTGFKAPLVILNTQFQLVPGRDYQIVYSGSHIESIRQMASGSRQVAAVAGDLLDREIKSGTIRPDQFRVVFTSDAFPAATFGHAHNLKPELAASIRAALIDFNWQGNSVGEYFAPGGQTKLVPINFKTDFAAVRSIDDQIGYVHQIKPKVEEDAQVLPTTLPATQAE